MKKLRNLPTLPPFPTFPPCLPLCYQPVRPTEGPTPTPTFTTTPQPSNPPLPTPFTFFDPIDCRNSGPSYPPTSAFLACFGRGRIPKNISGKVQLTGKPSDPRYTCFGLPEAETDVSFTRLADSGTSVDWNTGVFIWTNSSFETPLRMFIFFKDMIRSNPNLPDITDAYHFENSSDEDNSGSCSYDPTTGKTTFTLSGNSIFGAQGSSTERCTLSFKIEYEGTGDPVPPPFTCAPTKTPIPTKPPPTPTSTKTPTPSPSPSPTPTPSPSMSPTHTPTPSPSISPTPTPTPTST